VFYETGVAEGVPGGLKAPLCLGVTHWPNEMPWIWLEDVKGEPGTHWPRSRQVLAARHLGQFQGSYLAGRPLPADPIFERSDEYYADAAACVRKWMPRILSRMRENPLTRNTFGGRLGDRLETLGRKSRKLLQPMKKLPLTFCHRDFGPGNLLSRRREERAEETVALDWDFCGVGQIGIDAQSLVSTCTVQPGKSRAEVEEFAEAVFESYLKGLRDAGWKGDPAVARYAYLQVLGMRGSYHLAIHVDMLVGWGETSRSRLATYAEVLDYLLDLTSEAEKHERSVGAL